jgi:outer membrane receptor protein involved in Fe transport
MSKCQILWIIPFVVTSSGFAQNIIDMTPIDVIAAAPLAGFNIDRDKLPYQVQSLDRDALSRNGVPDALGTLNDQMPSLMLDQAQDNPYQPNLLYHGFEASPLVGDAQGLAVYVNGSRFNQPFGDTTNWDLIPDIAIDQLDIIDTNPVFGLNSLGGAMSVQLKNGFHYHGGELTIFGGSFGKLQGSFQYGQESHDTAVYIALQEENENGWREHSPSHVRQLYGDIGWRGPASELHLNIIGADNTLVGNGTTPVELLAVDRSAIFTYPDQTQNRYARVQLSGTVAISDSMSVQANGYYSNLSQRTLNGDAAEVESCDSQPNLICQQDGPPLLDRHGNVIPNFIFNSPYLTRYGFQNFSTGGPYSFLNQTATDSNAYGIQAQISRSDNVFGFNNDFLIGASYDGGSTEFTAATLLGGLTLDRGYFGPGIVIDSADGSISPVRVHAYNNYWGLFSSDTLDLTNRLSITASARLNFADTVLHDQLGSNVSGKHDYLHINPAIGMTYKFFPQVSIYANYAVSNRVPTPAELSCANASSPCSLTNFFVGDPDLKQVVAHTYEIGMRGRVNNNVHWQVAAFQTTNADDILFVSSPTIGRAYFTNVGSTLRRGVDVDLRYHAVRWQVYGNYTYTKATFQNDLTLSSEDNPASDANGNITVRKGNSLPGIPNHVIKIGGDYKLTEKWMLGASALFASGQYLYGDESNQTPQTKSYIVVNIHTSYQLTDDIQVFGLVNNVFDANYATYGTFSPVNATPILQVPNASNTRSLSPAPPIAGFAGVKITF